MAQDATGALGAKGPALTRLGLGAAPLSAMFKPVTEEQAQAIVDRAWELGLRFFDTAPLYGAGEGERRLGRALAGRPRDELVLSTKVGRLAEAGDRFDFSYDGVLRSVEESLARLGCDRVDVLFIHDPEDGQLEEAVTGAYRALDGLRSEGAVRAVGIGMNRVEPAVRLVRAANLDCCLLAGRYTLLDQSGLDELLPLCEREGIAVVAGGVYNSGILAAPAPGATFDYAPAPPELLRRTRRLEAICARHGVPLKAAAIQFPLRHPAVVSVLTGSGSVDELEENARMLEQPIPEELWAELQRERLVVI